jgi:hypothetical protein
MTELLTGYIELGEIDRDDWSGVQPHEWPEVIARAHRIAEEAAHRGFGAPRPKHPKRRATPDAPNESLLTYRQAAKILGISYGTMRNRCTGKTRIYDASHGLTRQVGDRSPRFKRTVFMQAIADGNLRDAGRSDIINDVKA